jgi:hypothetical protein
VTVQKDPYQTSAHITKISLTISYFQKFHRRTRNVKQFKYAATALRSVIENFQPTFEHSVIHNTNRCTSKYNFTPPSHICCFIGRKNNNIILNGIIINFGLCHLNQSLNYSLYNNAPPNFHWCWTNFICLSSPFGAPAYLVYIVVMRMDCGMGTFDRSYCVLWNNQMTRVERELCSGWPSPRWDSPTQFQVHCY